MIKNIYKKHKDFKKRFLKQKKKIFILFSLILLREILIRTPYVNIFINNNSDFINLFVVPVFLTILIGVNGKKFLTISLVLFFPLAIITFLGYNILSEELANYIYVLLFFSIVFMIVNFLKQKNV